VSVVFENRAIYDAARDPVAKVSVTVECHPKAAVELTNWLLGVSAKAGVYAVAIDAAKGDAGAKPVLEQTSLEPQDAERLGEEAARVWLEERSDAGAHGSVGRSAGKVRPGALGGRDESKGLPEVGRPVRRK